MTSTLTRAITGRRIKYLIILFWLVLVALAAPLAGKLTGVQQNDAKSWLPGSAESTQVLDAAGRVRLAGHRSRPWSSTSGRPGSPPADLAKVAGRRGRVRPDRPTSTARSSGRSRPADGQARADHRAAQPRRRTAGTRPATSRRPDDGRPPTPAPTGSTVYVTGPAGIAADSAEAFEGIDSTLLYATLAVVVRHPADHLPQPGAVAAAGHLGRRGADRAPRRSSTCWPSTPAWSSTRRAPAS